jgi:hypothetical protein
MFGADQSKLSTGTFRQARTGPKGKVRSYFFPSSSLQCLIGYFVSEEVFFVQGARKLHHVASPVVENCTCRRLQNGLRYSRPMLHFWITGLRSLPGNKSRLMPFAVALPGRKPRRNSRAARGDDAQVLIKHDERFPHGVHNRFRKCTGGCSFVNRSLNMASLVPIAHPAHTCRAARPTGGFRYKRNAAVVGKPRSVQPITLGPTPCVRLYNIDHYLGERERCNSGRRTDL